MTDASAAVQSVSVSTARAVPKAATAVGYAVATKGAVPRQLGASRKGLEANGFEGKVGQVLAVPTPDGLMVAVGVCDPGSIDAADLRTAAAAFARAASKHADLATNLADVDGVDAKVAAQAVVEGVLLASYRYVGLKNDESVGSKLTTLTMTAGPKRAKGVEQGAAAGHTVAAAAAFARELANTPPSYLNATDIADKAVVIGNDAGLTVEVFNKDDLAALGCGACRSA